MRHIPFNRPDVTDKEMEYITETLKSGVISGDGKFTSLCTKLLEDTLGVKKVLLTTSCTHALEMAAILLDIKEGDEVIVPSFTFVSTANAFVLRGARPVFVDINSNTLNMDETKLVSLINSNTKAIVPVHYAGVGCEMDAIMEISNRYKIAVVEDNAHGLFGKYKDKYLGTFGTFATQSFHGTKNFSSGEGGALIINDKKYIKRAEIIREKGTNRSHFFRGQVDKYTWRDVGSSYLPSDILAAFLYAQLERREAIQSKRQSLWEFYYDNLEAWADMNNIGLPSIPKYCDQAYHMFYLILPSSKERTEFINFLKENRIAAHFHYMPLNSSDMGRKFSEEKESCSVTEEISSRLVRLPFHTDLSLPDRKRVVKAVTSYEF